MIKLTILLCNIITHLKTVNINEDAKEIIQSMIFDLLEYIEEIEDIQHD